MRQSNPRAVEGNTPLQERHRLTCQAGGRRPWLPLVVVFVLIAGTGSERLLAPPSAFAQGIATPEYRVKATFLYQFAQFVDWPSDAFAGPAAPFVIGILGDDPFGRELEEMIRGESAANHPLGVRRFRRIEDVQDCHVLFVSRSEGVRLNEILTALRGRKILTVSEQERFADRGGMIQFVNEASRIRLTINLSATRTENLVVSSKLLRLATVIQPEQE